MNPGTRNFSVLAPELELTAARIGHRAAGGGQDRAAGRDIPFVRWRQPRIDVGLALRDVTEFHRRAAKKALGHGSRARKSSVASSRWLREVATMRRSGAGRVRMTLRS